MKKNITLQILILVLFVIGYSTAFSQGDYLVTIKGDTLRGKVKYFNNSGVKYAVSNAKYLQLTPAEGRKTTHQILQTISFKMDGEIYHTIKIDQGYTFMKLIKAGYLSLYNYQLENQTTWDGRYFVKKDGALLDIPNLGFKKRVPRYLADCPDVVKKIESGELSRTNLSEIVDTYNTCVELKTNPKPVSSPVMEAWTNLASAVQALPAFDKQQDTLEMIWEVQAKLTKKETIPSFLTTGIKEALKDQDSIKESLDRALTGLN